MSSAGLIGAGIVLALLGAILLSPVIEAIIFLLGWGAVIIGVIMAIIGLVGMFKSNN